MYTTCANYTQYGILGHHITTRLYFALSEWQPTGIVWPAKHWISIRVHSHILPMCHDTNSIFSFQDCHSTAMFIYGYPWVWPGVIWVWEWSTLDLLPSTTATWVLLHNRPWSIPEFAEIESKEEKETLPCSGHRQISCHVVLVMSSLNLIFPRT